MTKPSESISLSAEEAEGLIARVHQSGLSAEDAGVVEQVIRMYFWVVFCLQEAKLSLKRLRTLLFGKGPKTPKAPVSEESSASSELVGEGAGAERTGMDTTALVVKAGDRTIYYAGHAHAGENLKALLRGRQVERDKPLVMSDALSINEADETTLIRCHCLAHGRRQVSDLEDVFPQECQVVIEALKQVFDHDEQARNEQRSPEARLAYHQE